MTSPRWRQDLKRTYERIYRLPRSIALTIATYRASIAWAQENGLFVYV